MRADVGLLNAVTKLEVKVLQTFTGTHQEKLIFARFIFETLAFLSRLIYFDVLSHRCANLFEVFYFFILSSLHLFYYYYFSKQNVSYR